MAQELLDMLDKIWAFFFNFFYTLGDKIKGIISSAVPEEILPSEK